jgi:hypothetical protein
LLPKGFFNRNPALELPDTPVGSVGRVASSSEK